MTNGLRTTYVPGQWNAICDRCGGQFKSGELRRTWQGWYTCARCWEPRQTQDFVRGVKDSMNPPWTRPQLGIAGVPPPPPGNPPGPPLSTPAPTAAPGPAPAPAAASTSAIAGVAITGTAITGNTV